MVKQVMLFELELNDRRRQRRCIDRHVKLLEHIRDRANVVLVSVRDDHAADAVFVGLQVADVRDDHVNAVEVLIRKAHAAVDKEHILAILVNGEVLADLTEPAERDDFQFGCHSYLLYVRFRADCSPGSWLIFRNRNEMHCPRRRITRVFPESELSNLLHFHSVGQRPQERGIVRIFQIGADRNAVSQTCDLHVKRLEQARDVHNEFDRNEMILDKTEFDIQQMIKNTAASFEGTCTSKRISIELLLLAGNILVYADRRKIQQVLYNLIDNAIKFSGNDSSITIEVTEKNEKVFVSVKDTGMGIPKKELNKIWERFYKSDLSRGKDKKGTGLGLAIVKEAIQAHDEHINVISTEGVGTEFIFSLTKV